MHKPPVFPNIPVLLVDGNLYARRLVRSMLENAAIRHVVEASDGGEALERLTQFKPGLILIDWDIGLLSAYDLLRMLRDPSASTEVDVPVIAMALAPTRRLVAQAAERHVCHVLRKPFSPKMLWQRIAAFHAALDPILDVGPNIQGALLPDPMRGPRETGRSRLFQ